MVCPRRDANVRDEAGRLNTLAKSDLAREKAEAKAKKKAEGKGIGLDGTPGRLRCRAPASARSRSVAGPRVQCQLWSTRMALG